MKSKGFTLIELLVVIAIIGMLSAVILASLNTARAKGADAAIKENLANLRAQAEMYYDTNGNYGTTGAGNCSVTSAGVVTAVTGLCTGLLSNATFASGVKAATAVSGSTGYQNTSASGAGWAAFVPLKTTPTTYWCVDNLGSSEASTTIPTTATNC